MVGDAAPGDVHGGSVVGGGARKRETQRYVHRAAERRNLDRRHADVVVRCDDRVEFPADTVFVRAIRGEFDAVIAPYHDVGMTAIKVASFGSAVNVTLGLPVPRTSPDHGTALDIAGQGKADASSMKQAIRLCAEIVERTRR